MVTKVIGKEGLPGKEDNPVLKEKTEIPLKLSQALKRIRVIEKSSE